MREEIRRPKVDLDFDRLREVVSEAYRMVDDHVGSGMLTGREDVLGALEKQLACGITAAMFVIPVPCEKIPDLRLRVDPKRRQVHLLSVQKKKAAMMNRYMRILG